MKYSYVFLPEAQQEYEDSLQWYIERSHDAAVNFVAAVDYTLELICNHPYRWRNAYKNYYELRVRKYPYSLIYMIDRQQIIIMAVFHHKRHPRKKYKNK